ncbi:MAG: SDR family NAD(P)-dependent oxidoreductase [Deltaproteobacteria bacterium]|nr:SDR family NAD(P)-dependent oxidoreductase [Deltaproteobacteria bacterium]
MFLAGKKALITGGGRGIGRAIACALANEGVEIALLARTEKQLESVAELIGQKTKVVCITADLNELAKLPKVFEEIQQSLGPIDLLINNAGTGAHRPFLKGELADWVWTLNVNLIAGMYLAQLALPHMMAKQEGAIINIASMAGKMGLKDSAAYCASKFGVVGFSQALFEEVREHNIKVCAICPGYVDTPLIPKTPSLDRQKMIAPEDVAQTVLQVLQMNARVCPTEIILRPQRSPYATHSS